MYNESVSGQEGLETPKVVLDRQISKVVFCFVMLLCFHDDRETTHVVEEGYYSMSLVQKQLGTPPKSGNPHGSGYGENHV